jgi:ankyrin repeat protein
VSLTAEDNDGWQPIHCACDNGHLELVKWLAEQDGVSLTAEDKKTGCLAAHTLACDQWTPGGGQVAGGAGRGVADC